ncbi:MAG: type II toxin-antitoxin system HicB family antitoxin [Acaryochloridaceae cyanobacterium RL_2_7]|nr:type II toxin-antitoxin system HicB family antitoxin [Acaryochloridaceae cyanobacterium RL_2_7]
MSQHNTSTQHTKTLIDYLQQKYPITLCPEADGGYTALIPDLKGCMSQGETLEESLQNIEEARQIWIETAFEFQDVIPDPSTKQAWIK